MKKSCEKLIRSADHTNIYVDLFVFIGESLMTLIIIRYLFLQNSEKKSIKKTKE